MFSSEKQKAGIKRLQEIFGYDPLKVHNIQHGNAKPIRLRKGVPAIRDAEHQAKHKKRKAVNAARRKNRGR